MSRHIELSPVPPATFYLRCFAENGTDLTCEISIFIEYTFSINYYNKNMYIYLEYLNKLSNTLPDDVKQINSGDVLFLEQQTQQGRV